MYMLQFYTKNHVGGESENGSTIETQKFFLSCLCLLLGRFDRKKLESVVAENGMRISHVILPQVLMVLTFDYEFMKSPIPIICRRERQKICLLYHWYILCRMLVY